ncbi:hypothetical protein Bbelb_291010 [Branchiostoma belcheri]|nr:hypothetical protein Bbelb_291010 [Branchiostoma belcheri]
MAPGRHRVEWSRCQIKQEFHGEPSRKADPSSFARETTLDLRLDLEAIKGDDFSHAGRLRGDDDSSLQIKTPPSRHRRFRDRVFILTNQLQDGSDSADVETTSPTHASLPTPAPGRVTGTTSSRSIKLVTSPEIDWPTLTLSLVPMFLASLAGPMLVRLTVARPVVIAWEAEDKRERRELRATGDTGDGEHNSERLICPSFDGTFFFDDPDVLVFPKLHPDHRALSTRRLSASLPEASGDDGRPRRISRGHIRTNVPPHRQPADGSGFRFSCRETENVDKEKNIIESRENSEATCAPSPISWPSVRVEDETTCGQATSDAFVKPDSFVRPDAVIRSDAVIRPDAVIRSDAVIRPDAFVTPDAVIRSDAF